MRALLFQAVVMTTVVLSLSSARSQSTLPGLDLGSIVESAYPEQSGVSKALSSKVDTRLLRAAKAVRDVPVEKSSRAGVAMPGSLGLVRHDERSRLQVSVRVDAVDSALLSGLREEGLEVSAHNEQLGVVEGWIAGEDLERLSRRSRVRKITVPDYAYTMCAGASCTQGDTLHLVATARQNHTVDGQGVQVGVLSRGLECLVASQAAGELPPSLCIDPASVTNPNLCPAQRPDSEAVAMLEIIHDMASGAGLCVSSGNTKADFLNGLGWLVGQSVDIIVDDVFFPFEPYFEDGPVARQIRQAVTQSGVTWVTSAGNSGERHFEFDFQTVGNQCVRVQKSGVLVDVCPHLFSSNPLDLSNAVGVAVGPADFLIIIQWDDCFSQPDTDYDLFALDQAGNVIAASTGSQGAIPGGPGEALEWVVLQQVPQNAIFHLMVARAHPVAGPAAGPNNLKMLVLPLRGAGLMQYSMAERSIVGHAALSEVISVTAVDSTAPTLCAVEDFASQGPSVVGSCPDPRLNPDVRSTPTLAAVDRVTTSLSAPFDTFWGTSAAAPHVAGIAALVLQVSGFSPGEVARMLAASASDCGAAGWDPVYGHGTAVADGAVSMARGVFRRGDVDGDGTVSITDAQRILNCLFLGCVTPIHCEDAADANDDGQLNLTDPVRILGHLFLGQGPLAAPFPSCGIDPTPTDRFGCTPRSPCQ